MFFSIVEIFPGACGARAARALHGVYESPLLSNLPRPFYRRGRLQGAPVPGDLALLKT